MRVLVPPLHLPGAVVREPVPVRALVPPLHLPPAVARPQRRLVSVELHCQRPEALPVRRPGPVVECRRPAVAEFLPPVVVHAAVAVYSCRRQTVRRWP